MTDSAVVGILLAAGSSTRFGSDKLLHPLRDGVPIALLAAKKLHLICRRCISVLRPEQSALQSLLLAEGFEVLLNEEASQGMGRSLALAVQASPNASGWIVALADMPLIRRETYAALVEKLDQVGGIVAPFCDGRRGNPVGFSSDWYNALTQLHGDQGARSIIATHPQSLTLIPTDDGGILIDVDTPSDLGMV